MLARRAITPSDSPPPRDMLGLMSQRTKRELSLVQVHSRKLCSHKAILTMGLIVSTLLPGVGVGGYAQPVAKNGVEPVAVLSLFNVTTWRGPQVVEVPTGSIATPGSLDWRRVKLQVGGQTLPFSIREGRAHWQTRSRAPITVPRAEDLLVFTFAVPPGEWARVRVLVNGASHPTNHLTRNHGQYIIAYDALRAVIDETSGQLRELSFMDEPLLAGPLTNTINRLAEAAPYEFSGAFGPGFAEQAVPDSAGLYTTLAITPTIQIFTAGNYALQGTLTDVAGHVVATAGASAGSRSPPSCSRASPARRRRSASTAAPR